MNFTGGKKTIMRWCGGTTCQTILTPTCMFILWTNEMNQIALSPNKPLSCFHDYWERLKQCDTWIMQYSQACSTSFWSNHAVSKTDAEGRSRSIRHQNSSRMWHRLGGYFFFKPPQRVPGPCLKDQRRSPLSSFTLLRTALGKSSHAPCHGRCTQQLGFPSIFLSQKRGHRHTGFPAKMPE